MGNTLAGAGGPIELELAVHILSLAEFRFRRSGKKQIIFPGNRIFGKNSSRGVKQSGGLFDKIQYEVPLFWNVRAQRVR